MDKQKSILEFIQQKGFQIGERYIIKPRRDAIVWVDRELEDRHWTAVFKNVFNIHETFQHHDHKISGKRNILFSITKREFIITVIKSLFSFKTLRYFLKLKQIRINTDDPSYRDWIILPFKAEDFLVRGKKRMALQMPEKEIDLVELLIKRNQPIKLKESPNHAFEQAFLIYPPTGELLLRVGEKKFLYRYSMMKKYSSCISDKLGKYLERRLFVN